VSTAREHLIRFLEQLQKERLKAVANLEDIDREIEWVRARIAKLPLTTSHEPNTVDGVNTAPSSNALRSQKQIADGARNHRLVVAMEKKGLSFADVADALGEKLGRPVPRSTVQSWVKPKSDVAYRAIPEPAADALKSLYGVPLNAWPRRIPS
jgi:hypothetical protein